MNEIIRTLEREQLRTDIPAFRVGDTVRIQVNENYAYDVTILSIEKTGEDPDIPISTF